MENIITNPGLRHLAEKISLNLDVEQIKICGHVNQSFQQLIDDPLFWLRKFVGLSEGNKKYWIKVIQSLKTAEKEKAIISYLQWNLKKNILIYLPCYTSLAAQVHFKKRILESCRSMKKSSDEDVENIKIVTPLIDNPNAPDEFGRTPIYWAALFGHTEIVKILAPLTDNPNAPDKDGETPMDVAKSKDIRDILKSYEPS